MTDPIPITPETHSAVIVLDWKAYFMEFQRVHGGDPVEHKGRLLFRDGWMYSSTDYSGPEWKAPKDPRLLKELKVHYWTQRARKIRQELGPLRNIIHDIDQMQRERSAPLQQATMIVDKDGKPQKVVGPVETTGIRIRVEFLEFSLNECDLELTKLHNEELNPPQQDLQPEVILDE